MINSIKILIIDDNEYTRRKIKRTLSSLSEFNFDFFEAVNGKEALDLFENHRFALTFLDLRLPDIHGLEVLKRAQINNPELGEVIILTGYADDKTKHEAAILRVYAYLSKSHYSSSTVKETVSVLFTVIKRKTNNSCIFISYARPDKNEIQTNDLYKVKTIYDRLKENHFFCWQDDEEILAGQQWEIKISEAIEKSDFFLACLSSFSSHKVGYIQKEFMLAWMKQEKIQKLKPEKSYIIPIRLEDFEMPYPFNQLQHIDFFEMNWFKKLRAVIEFSKKY